METHGRGLSAALVVALLLAQGISSTAANGANWPQFRGPNGSGTAEEEQNPPIQFGPKQNVLWKTPVPSGHSSPCIWGDAVFLTGFDKARRQLQVLRLERGSGKIRWRRIVPAEQIEQVHPVSSPATATPATDGKRVYVYFGSYGLLAYDFAGKEQWALPLPVPTTHFGSGLHFGSGTSPIVSGELVILNRDEQKDPHLLAVDRRTGKTVWKRPQPPAHSLGAISYSTPVIWGNELIIHRLGEIVGHDAMDGARVWSVAAATSGISTPVIGKQAVYVGAWSTLGEAELRVELPDFPTLAKKFDKNGDQRISEAEFPDDLAYSRRPGLGDIPGARNYVKPHFPLVDQDRDGLVDAAEWVAGLAYISTLSRDHGLIALKPGGKGDVTATHVLWQEKTAVPEVPSPLYYGGRVYMVKDGGIASCMDAETGKLLYRQRLGTPGPYFSSPIAAPGRIYVASGDGVVVVMSPGDRLQVLAPRPVKGEPATRCLECRMVIGTLTVTALGRPRVGGHRR